MERENKGKRARDEDDNLSTNQGNTSAKKQNLNNYNLVIDDHEDMNKEEDIFQRLEVFDFPWLNEGKISKLEEDWKFEDTFSPSLEDSCTTINPGTLEIMSGQYACQNPAAVELLDYPEDKLEDDVGESVDGIWSSLLNQPLSAGFTDDNDRGFEIGLASSTPSTSVHR